jgi:hypothetical protein
LLDQKPEVPGLPTFNGIFSVISGVAIVLLS